MTPDALIDPVSWLQACGFASSDEPRLEEYLGWWRDRGLALSQGVDRAGTPWLKRYDVQGLAIDEIIFTAEYRSLLCKAYEAGIVWRAIETRSLMPFFRLGYVTAFHDSGLYCPYTLSMATALALEKRGEPLVKTWFLPPMLRKDEQVWQGATWFTERAGGSDLGQAVKTRAVQIAGRWVLDGEKYFCSNVGAELALVAARSPESQEGVRGLALFLVPRLRSDGTLNYLVTRLKDKIATRSVPTGEVELREAEAYLLSPEGQGIYAILEVLNLSRVANSIAAAALMQRALAETLRFGRQRVAFGRPIIEQPLLARQLEDWIETLRGVCALAFEAARLHEEVRTASVADPGMQALARLMAHIAKFWTAEQAALAAKWAMESHGGMGVLAEFNIERLLREAMVLAIWEGPPQRHCLDALEVMQRKQAHEPLLLRLAGLLSDAEATEVRQLIEGVLSLSQEIQEREAERVMRTLASYTAQALARRMEPGAIATI